MIRFTVAVWITLLMISSSVFAALPAITVDFEVGNVPSTLGLNAARGQQLASALRAEAISVLDSEFPFVEWAEPGNINNQAFKKVTEILFELKSVESIVASGHGPIVITCSFKKSGRPLGVPVVEVLPMLFDSPGKSAVVNVLTSKGKIALTKMISDGCSDWMTQFIPQVELGVPVVDRPDDKMLVVMIPVEIFAASSESQLLVTFENGPAGQAKLVKLWLSPYSSVLSDADPHAGMQLCKVKKFTIPPDIDIEGYDFPIGVALTMPRQLKVNVTDYQRVSGLDDVLASDFF